MNDLSFSNALLGFLLFRLGAIAYRRGSLTEGQINDRSSERGLTWLRDADELIVRHGTNRTEALKAVGLERAVSFLEKRSDVDSGQQIFRVGWWGRHVEPAATFSKIARSPHAGVEYVPPILRTHATTFVSTIATILQGLIDQQNRGKSQPQQFRVALHRLTRFSGADVFQQVTPYKGRIPSAAGIGRFFEVEGGIVGLACRTGSLVVAKKTDERKFKKIWELTQLYLTGAKEIKPYVDSLLCCPFFAPRSKRTRQRVLLALFIDSADPEFFNDEALQVISSACQGFVGLLESLHSEGMLRVLAGSIDGYEIPSRSETKLIKRLKRLGVKFVDASDKGWKKGLTFRTLQSVDFEAGDNVQVAIT